MSNPLFNLLGQNAGNMQGLVNQFAQFKQQFSGDPKAQVQQMLNNGQMTQEQFNQLSQAATQMQKMMKR